jgi:hypothetical protein
VTGKPVGNVTRYTYADGAERYIITFMRHSDIASMKLVDDLPWHRKAVAKLLGFDGGYLRFVGELRLEHYQGIALVESDVEDAHGNSCISARRALNPDSGALPRGRALSVEDLLAEVD